MKAIQRFLSVFNVIALLLMVGAYILLQQVQRPPAIPELPQVELAKEHKVKMKIFYSDAEVQNPKMIERDVSVTEEDAVSLAQSALNAWAAGPPATDGIMPVVPVGTPAPQVFLRAPHFFVNLPAEYANLKYGTSGERMLICSITRTLLEQRGETVTFLVNGKNVATLNHLDLRKAFTRKDCGNQ